MTDTNQDLTPVSETGFMLTGKTYDFVVKLVQLILPAFVTLYLGLSQIWGLPAAEKVAGTVALIITFLGVMLRLSNKNYHGSEASVDGNMLVVRDGGGVKAYSMELNGDPEALQDKDKVIFHVKSSTE